MSKKIIIITEVVFALVFIVMMSVVFSNVMGFGNASNANLENIRMYASEAELEPYNGTVVSGDTVVSTINKMKETKTGLKLSYIVHTNTWNTYGNKGIEQSSSGGTVYNVNGDVVSGITTSTPESKYYKYSLTARPKDNGFIIPVGEYNSTMLFNINGVFLGILFEEL